MKRTIVVLGLALATLVAAQTALAKEWQRIRIGVDGAYPPFSRIDEDGNLVGFDVDIAKALCDEMGAECTFVQQDWDGIIPALLARKYDAIIASMYVSQERDRKVDFTDVYYRMPLQFAAPKSLEIEISKEGVSGKRIGVLRASLEDEFVTDKFGDVAIIKRYKTQMNAFLDAAAGRVDLLLTALAVMRENFLDTEEGRDWKLVGPLYRDPKYFGEGAAIAVREEDNDLEAQFDAALDAILENGTYRRIQDKYFDFNVYGEPYGPDS